MAPSDDIISEHELKRLLSAQNDAIKALCIAVVKLQTALALSDTGASTDSGRTNQEASEFVDHAHELVLEVESKLKSR
jgi:hypothetical protein